jgi:hypothetical protein
LILITVVLAIIVTLFVGIQDPIVQKFAVRFAGGYLSEKTGADIKVGRLVVTPDLRIFIDDVIVKDLKKNVLASIDKLKTKIDITDLLGGKIHIKNAELRDTEANLIMYEGENQFNFGFFAEAFKSDKEKPEKEPMPIIVDKISLKKVDFLFWNQNKDNPEKTAQNLMDYAHIDLDDINFEASDFYMLGDSIRVNIASLSATELSGLELKHFGSEVVVCSNGIFLDGMKMETNNSLFDLDLHMLYDDFSAFQDFVNKVTFNATIRPTDVMLSDIGVFTSVMYKMPDRLLFEGLFTGPIEHFSVDNFKVEFGKSTMIQGNLSMHPLDFNDGEHVLKIKDMRFTYDDLVNFYIPSKTKTIPLPESLRRLNKGTINMNFKGSYNDFKSFICFKSGIGDIDASIARSKDSKGNNKFSGYIIGEKVQAGAVANASKFIGELDLNADFTAIFPKKGGMEIMVDGKITDAQLLGNRIDEVKLDGNLKENRFNGKLMVDDDDLSLNFNGLIDFNDKKHPQSDFDVVIYDADLHALHLLKEDSISRISTKMYVNLDGFDLDDLEGEVHIDSTLYIDSRGQYFMKKFDASITNDILMQRRINLNCDFFDFIMAGQINFASLMMTLNEYVDSFVHFPIWEDNREAFEKYRLKNDVNQDFTVQLALKDTKTISRLLMPSVKIAKNTTLNGTFTSRTNSLNFTLRSNNVQVGQLNFIDLELKNTNFRNVAFTSLKLNEIKYSNISPTDTLEIKLENFGISTRMTNDTIFGRLVWDDVLEKDINKALVETYFHPHNQGGIFSIMQADIRINDSLWTVSPSNFIDINGDEINISNLMFEHNKQSIRADGFVPMRAGDTLSVQLRSFDISNIDILTIDKGFDLDGFITGDAMLSGLKEKPMVLADLVIRNLGIDSDTIGDAAIESAWNNDEKSIDLNVNILDLGKQTLNVFGSYYTARKKDNLDFTVEMDSLRLAILNPFLAGVVSRMQGFGNGLITVKGSLDSPDINGRLKLNDGGCKIAYLNTFYTFSPTVLIDNQRIWFEDMILTDTLGNKAVVEGQIKHNYLKDFYLDLRMRPREFLVMATSSKDNETFYGTTVANGLVTVEGPFKDIKLDIKAITRKGTNFTIPLNQTSTVKDNDFIVFVTKEEEVEEEEEIVVPVKAKKEKTKGKFSLSLDINATDDASLKIFLPGNIGTIDATGNGRMKMNTATSEPFTMFGDYTIKTGRFQMTLYNIISRMFTLKEGGTLTWSGSPTDGRINATGAYSIKAPLSGLGVQVDSTSVSSNVNVECLIHLKGALLNPTITFGMNLPNATEDITQTVYSLVDTTNQAVMTQQAVSLLVLGQFAYAGGTGRSDAINLTNILLPSMQVDITDNINLGVSYRAGNEDTYDEYQFALRTHLFQNRLTIETNVGVMSSNSGAGSASNIVGEFDMYYKLTEDGRLQGHFYNHSNYNSNFNSFSFDKRSPYTQGLGLTFSKSFDKFRDIFKRKTLSIPSPNQPLLNKPTKKENE